MTDRPIFIEEGGARYFHQSAVNRYFGIIAQFPRHVVGLRQAMGEKLAFSDEELERRRSKLETSLIGLEEIIPQGIQRAWNLHPSPDNPWKNILNKDGVHYKEDALTQLLDAYVRFAEMESARYRGRPIHPDWQAGRERNTDQQTRAAEEINSISNYLTSLQTMPVAVVQLAGSYVAEVQLYLLSLRTGVPQQAAAQVTVMQDKAPISPN